MDKQLSSFGWNYLRIDATECAEAAGFKNGRIRANWLSHEQMIEKSLHYTEPALILEDDVVIENVKKVEQYVDQVQILDWDVLYFYGAQSLKRISGIVDVHGYVMNKKSIPSILECIRNQRRKIESGQLSNIDTFIDQYFAKDLQRRFKFWGTETLIRQDRRRFGSDTGWINSAQERELRKEPRLLFGCTVYREGPKLLGAFLASVRAQYGDQPIFVISDGIQNLDYPKVCAEHGAEYILGERLKVLDSGGAWWHRLFRKAASYPFDYFFKIDPDTRIHRRFKFFPEWELFGSKDSVNIQGGIQGFRRSAVDKIIRSRLLDSPALKNPETWARNDVTKAYVRKTGQISTDFVLMYIIHQLGMTWGDWKEVDSQWHLDRPFRNDVAATHPHKR